MHLLDLTLPTLEENLACDEALLLRAESIDLLEALRLWSWPSPAVVLGAGCRLTDDVDETACVKDKVPIGRRSSGGGTVLLGAGCLCYTLILDSQRQPELQGIRSSYCFILKRIGQALDGLLPEIAPAGTSDLASVGRKFSGNAQQRKRRFLLHHGTLLHAFDIEQIERYLRHPPRQPDYRQDRGHAAFLINLPATAVDLRHRLQEAWQAKATSSDYPQADVERLVREKYRPAEWIRRR
jgi:lipoate-protein ligase A